MVSERRPPGLSDSWWTGYDTQLHSHRDCRKHSATLHCMAPLRFLETTLSLCCFFSLSPTAWSFSLSVFFKNYLLNFNSIKETVTKTMLLSFLILWLHEYFTFFKESKVLYWLIILHLFSKKPEFKYNIFCFAQKHAEHSGVSFADPRRSSCSPPGLQVKPPPIRGKDSSLYVAYETLHWGEESPQFTLFCS